MNAQNFINDLMQHPNGRGVRAWVMDKCLSASNWVSEHIVGPAPYPSLRDSFGRWLEARLTLIWGRCYDGSDEETRDGIYFALTGNGVPYEYRSERQKEIARRLPEWIDTQDAAQ